MKEQDTPNNIEQAAEAAENDELAELLRSYRAQVEAMASYRATAKKNVSFENLQSVELPREKKCWWQKD